MKTIGLIGGMSWESSAVYYKLINQHVRELKGGTHSCPSIMWSMDFNQIERWQHEGRWDLLNNAMAHAAQKLEDAGAELIILCTNTMHLCYDAIISAIEVPFLHIAEATGQAIKAAGLKKVGLLGTLFTMEKGFYADWLEKRFEIDTIIPNETGRHVIHKVIYDELVQGNITKASKEAFLKVINRLVTEGAEGIILGCTEIPLLVQQEDVEIPLFDTTAIHAEAAVNKAM
ncbi:MAG TPA: aspartate racemase [Cytophagales bacterium]|jgi:aspartate racemase|nr:aspartate racemase [Cytophagales bacterium]